MSKKRPPNQAEREHMDRVASLSCIVCGDMGYHGTPAEIHHIAGHGVRASHFEVIPLCPIHHRNGGWGEAVHNGRRTWEANHGTERELLARVNRLLDV